MSNSTRTSDRDGAKGSRRGRRHAPRSGQESSQRPPRQDGRGRGANAGGSRGSGGKGADRSRRNRSSRGGRRGHARGQRQDSTSFWGNPAPLPESQGNVRITDDPAAVPRSLGAPPLAGHEAIAEHYFAAVYDRAVTTAGALAAAGGLIDPDGTA